MDTERARAILQRGHDMAQWLEQIAQQCDTAGLLAEAWDLRWFARAVTEMCDSYREGLRWAGLITP